MIEASGGPALAKTIASLPNHVTPLGITQSANYLKKYCTRGHFFTKKEIEESLGFCETTFVEADTLNVILAASEELCMRRKKYKKLPEEIRKITIKNKIRFWKQIIENNNIVFYCNSNVPHLIDDYIAFKLCQLKGIPILCFYRAPIVSGTLSRLLIFSDPLNQEQPLQIKNHSQTLPLDLERLYENTTINKRLPAYLESQPPKPKPQNKWKQAWRALNLRNARYTNPLTLLEYRINTEHPRGRDFFLLLLHFEPEASSKPLGKSFGDQYSLALTLSNCLPNDHYLCIKEHPLQRQIAPYRFRGFYSSLIRRNNVFFAHKSLDTYNLAEQSHGVISLTGSALLEYGLLGKPCIAMGTTPLSQLEGVYSPQTSHELAHLLQQLSTGHLKGASASDSFNFLTWLDAHSFEGYLEPYKETGIKEKWPEQENASRISTTLSATMFSLCGWRK